MYNNTIKTYIVNLKNRIDRKEGNPSLRNEKEIHKLLRANEHLLKGEDYYRSLYVCLQQIFVD